MGNAHTRISDGEDGDDGAVDGPKVLGEVKLAKTIIRKWLYCYFFCDYSIQILDYRTKCERS